MLKHIEQIRDEKIEIIKRNYVILDTVVNTVSETYQDIQLNTQDQVFITKINEEYVMFMGVPASNDRVSVVINENNNNRVAELTITPNYECEERYRKFKNIEIKHAVVDIFSKVMISIDNIITSIDDKEDTDVPEEEIPTVEAELVSE